MIKSDGMIACLAYSQAIKSSHLSLKVLGGPLGFSGQAVSREPGKLQAEGCGEPGPALCSHVFYPRPHARGRTYLLWGRVDKDILAN